MGGTSATAVRQGVVAACVISFAAGWTLTNIGAIPDETAAAYGVSLATVGLFTTALFITLTAMQVPAGKACDRFGSRRIGLIGAAIMIAGAALALPAPDLVWGLAGRLLAGVGVALAFIAGSAYVRSIGGSAFAQGMYGGIGVSAGGVALAIVPLLEPGLGWRAPHWSAIAASLVALLLLAAAPVDVGHLSLSRARATGVLRDRRLYGLAVLFAATFGLSVVIGNWVVEILQRNTGVGNAEAGAIGSLTLLLGVFSRPFGGWLLQRHPTIMRASLAVSIAAGALGTVMILLAGPLWLAVVGGTLIGLGGGISFSPAFTGAAMVRSDAPGSAVGFVNGSATLTVLVATPLVGLTFELPGDGRVGFAAVAALWLVALMMLPRGRSLGVPEADAVPGSRPAERV